jgi:hypothetical protein
MPTAMQALAWWIHDHVPGYASMCFFPKFAAFNIGWHEKPAKTILSRTPPNLGYLTRPGEANRDGSHEAEYRQYLHNIATG